MEILFAVLDEGVLREGRNAAQELGLALLETGD